MHFQDTNFGPKMSHVQGVIYVKFHGQKIIVVSVINILVQCLKAVLQDIPKTITVYTTWTLKLNVDDFMTIITYIHLQTHKSLPQNSKNSIL